MTRPDPQPAADIPALHDELATMISDLSHTGELSMLYRMEIADRITAMRAIIGTASPAPSDKIAEAARECRPETYASGVQCRTCGQSWGEDGPEQCPNAALAGKGAK